MEGRGNKAIDNRGAQRRVCVAAPATSSTEGARSEAKRRPCRAARQAAPATPVPRPTAAAPSPDIAAAPCPGFGAALALDQ